MKCVHFKPQPCGSLQQAQKQAFQLEVAPGCSSPRSCCSRASLHIPLPTSQQMHVQQHPSGKASRMHYKVLLYSVAKPGNGALPTTPELQGETLNPPDIREPPGLSVLRASSWDGAQGQRGYSLGCASLAVSLQPPPSCHLLGISGMHSAALWVITWSATADITSPRSSHYPASPHFPICRT